MGRTSHRAARRLQLETLEARTLLDGGLAAAPLDFSGLRLDQSTPHPTHILVHFQPGAPVAPALHGTAIGDKLPLVNSLYEVNLAPGVSVAMALAAYKADPVVLSAEADATVQVKQFPNDPKFALENNLYNTGQNGGTVGADIKAPAAWDVTHGNTSIIVSEMDTGIDYNHPDLYQNIWINQPEIPKSRLANLKDVDGDGVITFVDLNNPVNRGAGKITDLNGDGLITAADILAPMQVDANGNDTGGGGWAHNSTQDGDKAHPDDLIGWNFVANNNKPFDDNGHGTEIAGVLGATGNNGTGVVGVAWQTQLMAVKFLDSSGSGDIPTFIKALSYAVAHGAKVSNNSWGGGSGYSSSLFSAIKAAQAKGHIFVVAAGNDTANLDNAPQYPASFGLDNIVSVASVDRVDALAGYSNYGPATVAIAAPGENLWTTQVGGKYGTDSGTSLATPEVSGAVVLVWGLHPDWTYSQVINQVLGTATRGTYVQGKVVSGILNVGAAVGAPVIPVQPPQVIPPTPTPPPVVPPPVTPPSAGVTFSSAAAKNLEYYGSAISSISVNANLTVSNLQVQINVAHNRDSDLFIHLQAPDGTQVVLVNRRGGSGANFQATTFDDHAGTAIAQGTAPFAGSYRPESPLTAFNGKNTSGLWRLWVDDQVGNGNGAIASWSLTFNAGT